MGGDYAAERSVLLKPAAYGRFAADWSVSWGVPQRCGSIASLLMLRFVPAVALFGLCLASGLGASFYGRHAASAESARAALPFAAPFALFAVSAVGSFALSAAALADAAKDRKRSS